MHDPNQVIHQLKELLPTKQHLVFDFDKTIAQLEVDWSGWYPGIAKVYRSFDPEVSFDDQMNPHEFHNAQVDKHGVVLAKAINQFNQDYEVRHVYAYTPHQELVDLIKELDSHELYIYSSNSRPVVHRGLEELEIVDKFTTIVTRDDVHKVKPFPEGFRFIKAYPEHKASFLMIGDSGSDRGVAAAAGIDFLESTYFVKYQNE